MGSSDLSHCSDQKYHANVIKFVALASMLASAFLTVGAVSVGDTLVAVGLAVLCALNGVMLGSAFRGNLYWPDKLLPPITLLLMFYFIVVGNGIYDEGIVGIPVTIILAGLFLGRFWVIGHTILGVTVVSLVGWMQISGWLTPPYELSVTWFRIVTIDILIIFAGGLVYTTLHGLERALNAAREREN